MTTPLTTGGNVCFTYIPTSGSFLVRLVKEYEKIIDEYKDSNYILRELLDLEVGIESAFEKIINSMA